MNEHVENLSRNIENIGNEMSNIESEKNGTLGAIESITATSEETAAASMNLYETAENQLKVVEVLNRAAQGLKEDAIFLEEEVKVFRIN